MPECPAFPPTNREVHNSRMTTDQIMERARKAVAQSNRPTTLQRELARLGARGNAVRRGKVWKVQPVPVASLWWQRD